MTARHRRLQQWLWISLLVWLAACAPGGRIAQVTPLPGAAALPPTPSAAPTDAAPVPAPDFRLSGLDGSVYVLSELRGGWVVLNFWATWCEPCVAEMPALQRTAEMYAGVITLLGINVNEPAARAERFVQENAIGFPVLVNADDATLVAYQVIGLPQTVLVDPQGNIVWRQFGPIQAQAFTDLLAALITAG